MGCFIVAVDSRSLRAFVFACGESVNMSCLRELRCASSAARSNGSECETCAHEWCDMFESGTPRVRAFHYIRNTVRSVRKERAAQFCSMLVGLDRRVSGLPMGKTAARVDRFASEERPPYECIAYGQDHRTSGSTCDHNIGLVSAHER